MSGPTRAVIGAGQWGTTLALLLAGSSPVTLLARDEAHARRLDADRENRRYLPGHPLPPVVVITADPAAVASASELVLFAVPASGMRSTAQRVAPYVPSGAAVVSVAKGLERETLARMSEVLSAEIPHSADRVAALSGPNLAAEIARGLPAGAVVAAADDAVASGVQEVVGTRLFRLYRNRDVVGVELCGALKNIVAIAAGAAEALGFGDNGKAGLMTRGLAEMTRLGIAAGANPITFAGLAGIGDVIATCSSPLSRNHQLGAALASGGSWPGIEASLPGVAEGAYTVDAALELARRHDVEMPIAQEVHNVLFAGKSVQRALIDLLSREQKDELADFETWLSRVLARPAPDRGSTASPSGAAGGRC